MRVTTNSAGWDGPKPTPPRTRPLSTISASPLLGRRGERHRHGLRETLPARRLRAKSLPPQGGQPIVLRLAVVVRRPPLARDEPLVLEPVQGGIERPLLDRQRAARDLLDAQEHPVPVE